MYVSMCAVDGEWEASYWFLLHKRNCSWRGTYFRLSVPEIWVSMQVYEYIEHNSPSQLTHTHTHTHTHRDIAQKCYCGSANCRGYLGQTKQSGVKLGGAQRDVGSPSVRDGRRRGRPRAQSVEDSMVCVSECVCE